MDNRTEHFIARIAHSAAICREANLNVEELSGSIAVWDDATGAWYDMDHRDARNMASRILKGERYSDIVTQYPADEIGPYISEMTDREYGELDRGITQAIASACIDLTVAGAGHEDRSRAESIISSFFSDLIETMLAREISKETAAERIGGILQGVTHIHWAHALRVASVVVLRAWHGVK